MRIVMIAAALAALVANAGRQGPWTKEQAWAWYDKQPWIRGCNYMPASCANRVDQWQELGSEERFAEMDRELELAEKIGFNTMRIIIGEQGFGVWLAEHDGFMARFEKYLELLAKHKMRAIVVLGNDCSRPKQIWSLPKPGPQSFDWGYHGGRKLSQHGSFPNEVGFTVVDDPDLAPKFFQMCEEVLSKYKSDQRVLFWNLWNEPGNNKRSTLTIPVLKKIFALAWSIDPEQPLAADLWGNHGKSGAEKLAGQLSDIISYHSYSPYERQLALVNDLKARYGRPLINTEWMARMLGNEIIDCYPFFEQNKIGCTMWGFVAGKYQTYEPWIWMFTPDKDGRGRKYNFTKWFHDLYRPSLNPYDPREIDVITNINTIADSEYTKAAGGSLRQKIAVKHKIVAEDMWYGYRRTKFDFNGRTAWVVEPGMVPANGRPWTWTMQWAEAYVDRTGVLDMLKAGYHHVTLEAFDLRANDEGVAQFASFQKYLVEELGLAPKANLIGMSWGGFFSIRYASKFPENVRRIYLDAPLLTFEGFGNNDVSRIGPWANVPPQDGNWSQDKRMPVNRVEAIANAGIPILLLYGGQDQTVKPEINCEAFAEKFKAAGGKISISKRDLFGHHPHGVDPDKTSTIFEFFK